MYYKLGWQYQKGTQWRFTLTSLSNTWKFLILHISEIVHGKATSSILLILSSENLLPRCMGGFVFAGWDGQSKFWNSQWTTVLQTYKSQIN